MMRNISLSIAQQQLPVPGLVAQKAEDDYTIILNTDLPDTERAAAFLHEMLHIWHNDFASGKSVDQIEQERHVEMERILEILLKQQS